MSFWCAVTVWGDTRLSSSYSSRQFWRGFDSNPSQVVFDQMSFPVLLRGSGALGCLVSVLWPSKFLFPFHRVIIYVHVPCLCVLTFLLCIWTLSLLFVLWDLAGPLWILTRAGLCLIRFKTQTEEGPGCSCTTTRPHYTDLTCTARGDLYGPFQFQLLLRLARCTF